jgi:prepilin-type N-terminal cleavage/methylation domain-containing protein
LLHPSNGNIDNWGEDSLPGFTLSPWFRWGGGQRRIPSVPALAPLAKDISCFRGPGNRAVPDRTRAGFTLVEVLVALAAMAIGFVVLWGMHFASLRMERSDASRAEAIRIAKSVVEAQRHRNNKYPGNNATFSPACGSFSSCNCDNATIPTPLLFSNTGPGNDVDRLDNGNCVVQLNWPSDWQRRVVVTVGWNERISLLGGGGSANKRRQEIQLNAIYIDH